MQQIFHRGALSQKLGVREDVEAQSRPGICGQDVPDGSGGADGDGGLLDDDGVACSCGGDAAGRGFDVPEIEGAAGAGAVEFCGRVDGDEDKICLLYTSPSPRD